MYQGKYSERSNTTPVRKGTAKRRRLRWSKQFTVLACIAVLLTGLVGSSLAWLMADTGPVINVFEPGKVPPTIHEEMNDNIKRNISIENTGNVPAYIRAKLVFTWQDPEGNILGQVPVVNEDYQMSGIGKGWRPDSGYYYFTTKVEPGESTGVLCDSITQIGNNPAEGYTLHVEVLSESIQAEPVKAVQEAWKLTPSNAD